MAATETYHFPCGSEPLGSQYLSRFASQLALAGLSISGRKGTALDHQGFILEIGRGSVCLESRVRHFLIKLLALSDRIGLSSSALLRYVDTINAGTIKTEYLSFKRRRKVRVTVPVD